MFFLPAVGLQWRDKQHLKSGKVPLTLTQATLSCQEHLGSDVGIVLGDFFITDVGQVMALEIKALE